MESPEIKVTLRRNPLTLEFEVGSIDELIGVLEGGKEKLSRAIAYADELNVPAPEGQDEAPVTAAPEPAKRGRKPKNQPDPATAQAPAPAPIPAPAPAAPVVDTGVPAFLDRKNPDSVVNQPAAAPPPPLPAPAAPSVVPAQQAAPPISTLAPKIIDALNARAVNDDAKKALVEWLAAPGISLTVKAASYEEAIECLRMIGDDKLAVLLTPLGL